MHLMAVKILFQKPHNWEIVDDHDLYMMWVLPKYNQCNWVKVILNNIEYCRISLKKYLFLCYFTQFILELNGVTFVEEDLVEAPKPVDLTMIKLMCYFQDEKVVHYYMGNIGMYVYEDKIEVSKVVGAKRKKSTSAPSQAALDLISSSSYAPSRSSGGVLFVDAKTYFDALDSKI